MQRPQAVQVRGAHPVLYAVQQQGCLPIAGDDAVELQETQQSLSRRPSSRGFAPCTAMTAG